MSIDGTYEDFDPKGLDRKAVRKWTPEEVRELTDSTSATSAFSPPPLNPPFSLPLPPTLALPPISYLPFRLLLLLRSLLSLPIPFPPRAISAVFFHPPFSLMVGLWVGCADDQASRRAWHSILGAHRSETSRPNWQAGEPAISFFPLWIGVKVIRIAVAGQRKTSVPMKKSRPTPLGRHRLASTVWFSLTIGG